MTVRRSRALLIVSTGVAASIVSYALTRPPPPQWSLRAEQAVARLLELEGNQVRVSGPLVHGSWSAPLDCDRELELQAGPGRALSVHLESCAGREHFCELPDGQPLFDYASPELYVSGKLERRGQEAHVVGARLIIYSSFTEQLERSRKRREVPARCALWRPGYVCPACEVARAAPAATGP